MKKVTVIGGGTGTFVVLSGLKKYNLDLSSIVTMMDSGGSTGKLRDQLGVLPPGDIRQCLVALSEASELWRKLFLYRFDNGDLKGHNFGNIFLSALEKVSDNYNIVIETASYVLKTKGNVIPVTFEKTHLCVEYENGTVIKGEKNIDEDNPERSKIVNAYLDPRPSVNPLAIKTIEESDFIIIGPGDLYTSIIPILLVNNLKNCISRSNAKIIYNLNLMTKAGQTSSYTGLDFIAEIFKYAGRYPDYVIVNSGNIPNHILDWYRTHDESPVFDNLHVNGFRGKILKADVINRSYFQKDSADKLSRSILRHDTDKLVPLLMKIIKND